MPEPVELCASRSSGDRLGVVPTRFRAGLAAITVGALVLRVAYILGARRDFPLKGDDYFYHWQGRAIADGLGFINPFSLNALDRLDPTAAHPPLYSLFLAAVSTVGIDTPIGHRLASSVLGALAVAVIGLAGRRIGGPRAGLLAAAVAAVYPALWINDGMLTSETPYVLLIAGVVLAAYEWIARPTLWRIAAVGALVGLAALTRPEAILLLPIIGASILIGRRRNPTGTVEEGRAVETSGRLADWKPRFKTIVVLGAVGMAVVTPWLIRNLTTFDKPVLLASGHGSVLEVSNCDPTYRGPLLGYWDITCITGARPPENEQQRRLLENSSVPGLVYLLAQDNRDESVADQRARERGLDYIGDHLGRAPLVAAARVARVWGLYRPAQQLDLDVFFERRGLWPSRVALAMYYVLALLSVWQLAAMRRRRQPIWPLVSILVMTTFTAAVSIGITRYRVGGDVVLAVLGGVAIDRLWTSARDRRARDAGVA